MKAKRLCLDRISTLPTNIIENILCLLPIKEAARTSVLSRNWRYNWVTIPKLEFRSHDFRETSDLMGLKLESPSERTVMTMGCRMLYAIYQILLVHRGPITEFTLTTDADDSCVKIDQIIRHLFKNNTLKKLKLHFVEEAAKYRVPISIFSLHQLMDLYLCNCSFDHRSSTFNGFGSLTCLHLDYVRITAETLLHLLSNSPLLKSFTLIMSNDYPLDYANFTIRDLLNSLPGIEHLTILEEAIMWFAYDDAARKSPTSLVNLKYLSVDNLCFNLKDGLPRLFLWIRWSPNLEKLELKSCGKYGAKKKYETDLADYSDIWLEHLNELVIENFLNMKQEMKFVELILAKSPMLKRVKIVFYPGVTTKKEELKMFRVLSSFPCASPVIKFYGVRHWLRLSG